MEDNKRDILLRKIPGVNQVLNIPGIADLLKDVPRERVTPAIRNVLAAIRKEIFNSDAAKSEDIKVSGDHLVKAVFIELSRLNDPSLIRVINATGVIVHTNLGRSPLSPEALRNLLDIGGSYSNLEFDLKTSKRGSRYSHLDDVLRRLSGAESSLVVNNNAAAVLLVLSTIGRGKEVIVSRGELIEIGGSFRIPDIMRESGVKLVEVGTTNRTHIHDYESAITRETSLLLKVHSSNYHIVGFTSQVELRDMVKLGSRFNIPVANDLGSGNFIDLSRYGLIKEPTVQEAVKTGADLITFSGDKLLGGTQAGIILGKKLYLDRIKTNPLNRALRIDKLTLGALEPTLRLYFDEKEAIKNIPTLNMLTISLEEIEKKAKELSLILKRDIFRELELAISIRNDNSKVGGGALPLQNLATRVVAVKSEKISINVLEASLRNNRPPIIGRIYQDELLMDVRTIRDDELKEIGTALERICRESSP